MSYSWHPSAGHHHDGASSQSDGSEPSTSPTNSGGDSSSGGVGDTRFPNNVGISVISKQLEARTKSTRTSAGPSNDGTMRIRPSPGFASTISRGGSRAIPPTFPGNGAVLSRSRGGLSPVIESPQRSASLSALRTNPFLVIRDGDSDSMSESSDGSMHPSQLTSLLSPSEEALYTVYDGLSSGKLPMLDPIGTPARHAGIQAAPSPWNPPKYNAQAHTSYDSSRPDTGRGAARRSLPIGISTTPEDMTKTSTSEGGVRLPIPDASRQSIPIRTGFDSARAELLAGLRRPSFQPKAISHVAKGSNITGHVGLEDRQHHENNDFDGPSGHNTPRRYSRRTLQSLAPAEVKAVEPSGGPANYPHPVNMPHQSIKTMPRWRTRCSQPLSIGLPPKSGSTSNISQSTVTAVPSSKGMPPKAMSTPNMLRDSDNISMGSSPDAKALAAAIKSGSGWPDLHSLRGPQPAPFRFHRDLEVEDIAVDSWESGIQPSVLEAAQMEVHPFTDVGYEKQRTKGIKGTTMIHVGNIPWDVPKQSICEALAADDHLALNNAGYPLFHFTMDRAAQKTWDCFVEIKTEEAALVLVGELMAHPVRISSRTAIVNIVEPHQLLMCLFPRAKCIVWEGDKPLLISCRPGETPFRGFLMQEELYLISRAAESPQKLSKSRPMGVSQRPWEDMISLAHKYPWDELELITVAERDRFFTTYLEMAIILCEKLHRFGVHDGLNFKLLEEFVLTGAKCAGFTEMQRTKIIQDTHHVAQTGIKIHPVTERWPFRALVRNPRSTDRRLEYFVNLLKQASLVCLGDGSRHAPGSIELRNWHYAHGEAHARPFGLAGQRSLAMDVTTLGEMILIEYQEVEDLLKILLPISRQNAESASEHRRGAFIQ